jgi:hypothetical protein
VKDDILDLYKAAGHRPDRIEWDESKGTLVLRGDSTYSDWFAEWAVSGRRGIEGYLAGIGDPRFPYAQTLFDRCCSSESLVDLSASDDEIVRQILKADSELDEPWVRRLIPRLKELGRPLQLC